MSLTERALDEYTREEHRSSRMKNENDKLASFKLQCKSSGIEIKRYVFISPMDNDMTTKTGKSNEDMIHAKAISLIHLQGSRNIDYM